MKDLGTYNYFLVLEITSSSNGYYLSHSKYASNLFFKACILNKKITYNLLKVNAKLTTTYSEPFSDTTI